MEPYPLYNWAKARHTLDTKTNRGVPNTYTNYQTSWKIGLEVHGISDDSPKPALPKMDLNLVLPGDVQVYPFHCKPKIPLPQVAIFGGGGTYPNLASVFPEVPTT